MNKFQNRISHNILGLIYLLFFVSISAYAQDTSDISSPSSRNVPFNDDAAQLSNNLIEQIGLSADKVDEISQILIEYHNDIAEARNKSFEQKHDTDNNQDATGGERTLDMNGILGDNVEQYYAGASPDLLAGYKNADKKVESRILEVMDTEEQNMKYAQFKGSWWTNVKDKIFTSLDQTPQRPLK